MSAIEDRLAAIRVLLEQGDAPVVSESKHGIIVYRTLSNNEIRAIYLAAATPIRMRGRSVERAELVRRWAERWLGPGEDKHKVALEDLLGELEALEPRKKK